MASPIATTRSLPSTTSSRQVASVRPFRTTSPMASRSPWTPASRWRCCTALAESEIRLWWWPRYVSSMKYPKRCQYKHAKQKKYDVRNWAEYNDGLRAPGRFDSLV